MYGDDGSLPARNRRRLEEGSFDDDSDADGENGAGEDLIDYADGDDDDEL